MLDVASASASGSRAENHDCLPLPGNRRRSAGSMWADSSEGLGKTIGAVLRVKDDFDLLAQNLAYHRSVGVDYFVLCDTGSTAEGLARLEALDKQADYVHLFRLDLYRSAKIDSETLKRIRLACFEKMAEVFSPSWTLVPDVDEFWIPGNGDLKSALAESTADHLEVVRYNAALRRDAPPPDFEGFDEAALLDIIVKPMVLTREGMDQEPDLPWIRNRIAPKFITRVKKPTEISPGFHDLRAGGAFERQTRHDLLVLHLPFTTFERFARKVDNVRNHLKYVEHTFAASQAWHWQRWAQIADAESLRAEFERQFFGHEELAELKRRGVVMKIRDFLADQTRSLAAAAERA